MIARLDTPAAPSRRTLRLVLALIGAGLVVLLLAVYAARKVIAREALVGWLQSRGVAADATVEAIGPTGFIGTLRIGDPRHPDFTAERVEVRYAIKGLAVEIGAVTLRRPVLRGRIARGRLNLGALDPLIAEFAARPPRPDARQPTVTVTGGRILLATDLGPLDATADALVDGGKLMRLSATTAPTTLKSPVFTAALGQGRLTLRTHADTVKLDIQAPVARAEAGAARVEHGMLTLDGTLPYPDLQRRRGDGAVVLNGKLAGERIVLDGRGLDAAVLEVAFLGQARGWIADLAVTGRAVANLAATGGSADGAVVRGLKVAATADDVDWRRAGGDRVSAVLKVAGGVEDLTFDALRLRRTAVAMQGSVSADRQALSARLSGSLNGRGASTGMGPVRGDDAPEIAAVKRALADFRVAAPGLVLAMDQRGPAASLTRPVRVTTASGGHATLATPHPGAYALAISGGGLPKVSVQVSNLAFTPGAATARIEAKAALSLPPIEGVEIDLAGGLRLAGGGVSFTAARCVTVRAAKVELGDNDIEAFSGRLCPDGAAPLLTLAGGGLRLAARAEDVSARAPFLQARISEASGPLRLAMAGGKMSADVAIAAARVQDTAPQVRFNPLPLTGTAGLANAIWTAHLAVGAPRVATIRLTHDGAARNGSVEIETGKLAFAPGGLQPADLSPMAAMIGPPVTGEAEFAGQVSWTPTTLNSGGALALRDFDFVSPAGRVQGLTGEIGFSSLAPLIAAAGQTLTVRQIDALVPITDVRATFALGEQSLIISGGQAQVGGGRVDVETLELPLTPETPMRGVLGLVGVQLHDLVEVSPFGDKVDLFARVDGRVPFESHRGAVKVANGSLKAVEPGRLSIQRSALAGVAANSDATPVETAAPPNTVADFAYQALENLAFDQLDATLNSQEKGRLGVRFHILGRHDPPQKQQIRLGLMDLIRRDFLNKPLPLPSGVKVDLTLDTSLNLDDLLRDYGEYQNLRSSPPVQSPTATTSR